MPRGSESEDELSFFPRGGSLRSGQLFEGGEQVSVAELQGCVHLLHIRELPPQVVACPLMVLLTVCGVRGYRSFIFFYHLNIYGQYLWSTSVADPDPGSKNRDPGSKIRDPVPF